MSTPYTPPSDPELRQLVATDLHVVGIVPMPSDRKQRAYFQQLQAALALKLQILAEQNGAS